jgi:hypothetical protein
LEDKFSIVLRWFSHLFTSVVVIFLPSKPAEDGDPGIFFAVGEGLVAGIGILFGDGEGLVAGIGILFGDGEGLVFGFGDGLGLGFGDGLGLGDVTHLIVNVKSVGSLSPSEFSPTTRAKSCPHEPLNALYVPNTTAVGVRFRRFFLPLPLVDGGVSFPFVGG